MKTTHVLNLIRAYQGFYLESQLDAMASCHLHIEAWLRVGSEIRCYEYKGLTDISNLNLLPTDKYILFVGGSDATENLNLLQKQLCELIDEGTEIISYTDAFVQNPKIVCDDSKSYLYVISES